LKMTNAGIIIFLIIAVSLNASGQSGPYVSFESHNFPGEFIRHALGQGELQQIRVTLDMKDATFAIIPGLSDSRYASFESLNYPGNYLRHQNARLKLNNSDDDGSRYKTLKEDATFKIVPGLADLNAVSFESVNYPGTFIRHRKGDLYVEADDGGSSFKEDATFRIVAPRYSP
jgi:hypothetical protein